MAVSFRFDGLDEFDVAGHQVLADALQAAGDPRGELMALRLAAQDRPIHDPVHEAIHRLEWDHRHLLRGPFVGWERPLLWKAPLGILRELQVNVITHGRQTRDALRAAQEQGLLQGLHRLRLVGTIGFGDLAAWCSTCGLPLRSLAMGPMMPGYGNLTGISAETLLSGLPELEHLVLPYVAEVGSLRHASLTELLFSARAQQRWDLRQLPALRTVRVVYPLATDLLVADGVTVHTGRPRLDENFDPLLTPASERRRRRFERNGRFWEIHREDAVVVLRHGKVGRDGTRREKVHRGAYVAACALREKVNAKRTEGWTEVRP